jgi:hypothetical protein
MYESPTARILMVVLRSTEHCTSRPELDRADATTITSSCPDNKRWTTFRERKGV